MPVHSNSIAVEGPWQPIPARQQLLEPPASLNEIRLGLFAVGPLFAITISQSKSALVPPQMRFNSLFERANGHTLAYSFNSHRRPSPRLPTDQHMAHPGSGANLPHPERRPTKSLGLFLQAIYLTFAAHQRQSTTHKLPQNVCFAEADLACGLRGPHNNQCLGYCEPCRCPGLCQ